MEIESKPIYLFSIVGLKILCCRHGAEQGQFVLSPKERRGRDRMLRSEISATKPYDVTCFFPVFLDILLEVTCCENPQKNWYKNCGKMKQRF